MSKRLLEIVCLDPMERRDLILKQDKEIKEKDEKIYLLKKYAAQPEQLHNQWKTIRRCEGMLEQIMNSEFITDEWFFKIQKYFKE